jgi:Glycosyl transferase family 2
MRPYPRWLNDWRVPKPRVAMLACARNEEELLPAFLLYHHAIGIERIYLFLDRCTDASAELAGRFPWVRALAVDPEEAARFPYVADLHAACMNHALQLARQEGFHWLLVLDPDEFAFANNPGGSLIERADLRAMLRNVDTTISAVRLPTRELVPAPLSEESPFWKQRFFQTEPRLEWRLYDPVSGETHAWREFIGHRQGKYLVRTSLAVQAYDSHRWVPEQGRRFPDRPQFVPLPTEDRGWHLHFYTSSQRQWRDKFRKLAFEPERWICGNPVEPPKLLWRRATAAPDALIADYFPRWIAWPIDDLRALATRGLVVEEDGVEAVLREAGHLAGDTLILPEHYARRAAEPFYPASDKGPSLARDVLGRVLDYPAALTPAVDLKGSHPLEIVGGEIFRWLEPYAAFRLQTVPARYWLRLHMGELCGLWAGTLDLSMNGRPIPARERHIEAGTLLQLLLPDDFTHGPDYWLEMRFAPVDTAAMRPPDPRPLGAPLFRLTLCEYP